MMRRLIRDRSGASAVEFALVAPFLMALMFGGMVMALGIWTGNLLQETSQEAARCIAIGSSACATVSAGCDSSSPGVCYAETVAANRGLSPLPASNITVSSNVMSGGVSFTTVKITYPFSMIGYSYTLVGYGSFPNAS